MRVDQLSVEARAKLRVRALGLVFQHHYLLPDLSVLGNLLVPGLILGEDLTERAEALLTQVGLGGRGAAYPDVLSGGERQRLAVARALMARPAALLADEPTGSLDRANADRVARLMIGLAREYGSGVLLVTHDEALAALADRQIHLLDGRLAEPSPGPDVDRRALSLSPGDGSVKLKGGNQSKAGRALSRPGPLSRPDLANGADGNGARAPLVRLGTAAHPDVDGVGQAHVHGVLDDEDAATQQPGAVVQRDAAAVRKDPQQITAQGDDAGTDPRAGGGDERAAVGLAHVAAVGGGAHHPADPTGDGGAAPRDGRLAGPGLGALSCAAFDLG